MDELFDQQGVFDVTGRDDVDDVPQNEDAARLLVEKALEDWSDKAMKAAFNVVKYGIFQRQGLEHMDQVPLDSGLSAVTDAASRILMEHGDGEVRAAVGLVSLWKDVIQCRTEASEAQERGGYDFKAIEAAAILEERAKSDAHALFPGKFPAQRLKSKK